MNDAENLSDVRRDIERAEKWRLLVPQIPYIQFPADWKVQVIPPFGGAIARFVVMLPSGNGKSVYLDFYDRCGHEGHPYWEVHPYRVDCGRCALNEVDELLRMIADESEDA